MEPSFANVMRAVGALGWDLMAALVPQEKLPPKQDWPHGRAPVPTRIRPASIELMSFDNESVDELGLHQRRLFKQWRAERRRARNDDRQRPRRRAE